MTRTPFSVTPRGIVGTLIVLIVATVCVRLGFWQLDRRQQRAAINAAIEERVARPPVDLDRAPDDTAGWLYRRARITGVPDADRAIILPGRLYRGSPGAHVLVPVPLGAGDAILVDLGWAPAADGANVDLERLPLDASLDAVGLLLPFPGEERGARTGGNAGNGSTFRRIWYAPDPDAMREQFPYDLGRVHLQLLPAEPAPSLPVRIAAPPLDPGPHLGYAIQWFSFATIAIVGWLIMVTKSTAGRAPPAPEE